MGAVAHSRSQLEVCYCFSDDIGLLQSSSLRRSPLCGDATLWSCKCLKILYYSPCASQCSEQISGVSGWLLLFPSEGGKADIVITPLSFAEGGTEARSLCVFL